MNNYQITEVQKHNLEVALKNAHSQILHLENLLQIRTENFNQQATTELTLSMIESNTEVLNGLYEITQDALVDLESDVQN